MNKEKDLYDKWIKVLDCEHNMQSPRSFIRWEKTLNKIYKDHYEDLFYGGDEAHL